MIVRLRSRDGLERVTVPDSATLADLLRAIQETTGVSPEDATLSFDAALLSATASSTAVAVATLDKSAAASSPLASLGIAHGSLLHLHYPFEREVAPVAKPEEKSFGAKMTMGELISRFVRVERQAAPGGGLTAASLERHAADAFQAYVSGMTNFSVARAGILYGRFEEVEEEEEGAKEEEGGGDAAMETEEAAAAAAEAAAANGGDDGGEGDGEGRGREEKPPRSVIARVEAIFEPPQECTADGVRMERGGPDEQLADFVAEQLGLRKVGWILAQSRKPRDFIVSDRELRQMSAMQDEVGPAAVVAVVSCAPAADAEAAGASAAAAAPADVHFEAFQVSAQCVRLNRDGWLKPGNGGGETGEGQGEGGHGGGGGGGGEAPAATPPPPSGVSRLVDPNEPKKKNPVIVAGKDASQVDNDYFLVPVPIRDHGGPLRSSFAVENRLLPQGAAELASFLSSAKRQPAPLRFADFHLLLWLAKQPSLSHADVAAIAASVAAGEPVSEGYGLILESLAQGG